MTQIIEPRYLLVSKDELITIEGNRVIKREKIEDIVGYEDILPSIEEVRAEENIETLEPSVPIRNVYDAGNDEILITINVSYATYEENIDDISIKADRFYCVFYNYITKSIFKIRIDQLNRQSIDFKDDTFITYDFGKGTIIKIDRKTNSYSIYGIKFAPAGIEAISIKYSLVKFNDELYSLLHDPNLLGLYRERELVLTIDKKSTSILSYQVFTTEDRLIIITTESVDHIRIFNRDLVLVDVIRMSNNITTPIYRLFNNDLYVIRSSITKMDLYTRKITHIPVEGHNNAVIDVISSSNVIFESPYEIKVQNLKTKEIMKDNIEDKGVYDVDYRKVNEKKDIYGFQLNHITANGDKYGTINVPITTLISYNQFVYIGFLFTISNKIYKINLKTNILFSKRLSNTTYKVNIPYVNKNINNTVIKFI